MVLGHQSFNGFLTIKLKYFLYIASLRERKCFGMCLYEVKVELFEIKSIQALNSGKGSVCLPILKCLAQVNRCTVECGSLTCVDCERVRNLEGNLEGVADEFNFTVV